MLYTLYTHCIRKERTMNTRYSKELFWIILDDPFLYVLAMMLIGLWAFAIGMLIGFAL